MPRIGFCCIPLIESEKVDLENLQMGYNLYFQTLSTHYQISVVHSK
jgi:hypothetical protein